VSGSDFTGLTLPDTYGALRAFREWRVPAPNGPLLSLWQSVAWVTSALRADCRVTSFAKAFILNPVSKLAGHPGEPAPRYDCTCGIYACWYPAADPGMTRQIVTGVVEVSGTCIVGTRGVRAQSAVIRALAPTSADDAPRREAVDWPALRPVLARCYPGVALFDAAEEMWEAWPPQPPLALIEEAQNAAA